MSDEDAINAEADALWDAFKNKVQAAYEEYCASRYPSDEEWTSVVLPSDWIFIGSYIKPEGDRKTVVAISDRTPDYIGIGLMRRELAVQEGWITAKMVKDALND